MSKAERAEVPNHLKSVAAGIIRQTRGLVIKPDPIQIYVGTTVESGKKQYEFLRDLGMKESDYVLEVGHGALNASQHIIEFLEPGHFVGIDPNDWLRNEVVRANSKVASLVKEKDPKFLENENFDASELGMKFDLVLSHSVLSHAASWQLPLFLENVSACLKPNGKILASIRLSEGNNFGSAGYKDCEDSLSEDWVYPGNSYFKKSTVESLASQFGLKMIVREDFTKRLTDFRKGEFHDWLIFEK